MLKSLEFLPLLLLLQVLMNILLQAQLPAGMSKCAAMLEGNCGASNLLCVGPHSADRSHALQRHNLSLYAYSSSCCGTIIASIRSYAYAHMCIQACTRARARTHTHTHILTHAHMLALRTHTCLLARARVHTRTQTHSLLIQDYVLYCQLKLSMRGMSLLNIHMHI